MLIGCYETDHYNWLRITLHIFTKLIEIMRVLTTLFRLHIMTQIF